MTNQQAYGVYGYKITKELNVLGLRLMPRYQNISEIKQLITNKQELPLTAIAIGNADNEKIFELEAILSFIEGLGIHISAPQTIQPNELEPFQLFPSKTITRHGTDRECIMNDAFMPNSRRDFIEKIYQKLTDEEFCHATTFRKLFFKCVESLRQYPNYIETEYFYLYSGLESYCRSVSDTGKSKNSSAPIANTLNALGFDVAEHNNDDLRRSISTYSHLRNAIFHNSQLCVKVNINNTQVELKAADYLFNLSTLTQLVILKIIQFDDGHINWNSWIDRMPFK